MDSFFLPLLKSVHLHKKRNELKFSNNIMVISDICRCDKSFFLIYTSIFQMIKKSPKWF